MQSLSFFATDNFEYSYVGGAPGKKLTVGFRPGDTFQLSIRNPKGLRHIIWLAERVIAGQSSTREDLPQVDPATSVSASLSTLPNAGDTTAPTATPAPTRAQSALIFKSESKHEPRKSKPNVIRGQFEGDLVALSWQRPKDFTCVDPIQWNVQVFVLDPRDRQRAPKEMVSFALTFECSYPSSSISWTQLELVDESKQTDLMKQVELNNAGPRNTVVNLGFMIPILLVFGLFMPLDTFSAEAGRIWMGFGWGLFGMWIKQKFDHLD